MRTPCILGLWLVFRFICNSNCTIEMDYNDMPPFNNRETELAFKHITFAR